MGTGASIADEREEETISVSGINDKIKNQKYEVIKANIVTVDQNGFSNQRLILSIGQAVNFLWDTGSESVETNNQDDTNLFNQHGVKHDKMSYSILQVIDDDSSGKFRPVIGGFSSGKPSSKGNVAFNFKIIGEFKFKIYNHPKDPPPCIISVTDEQPISAQLFDDGFRPKYIKIEEGRSIKWDWSYCSIPHSVYEAEFCDSHYGLCTISKELVVAACSNTYRRVFPESGIYYFQTESKNKEKKNVCVVEVVESFSEHKIDILDSRFSPMLLSIEEGDKVWFSWNKEKCSKKHAIYEIVLPMPDHANTEAYFEKKDGFKWPQASHNGLLCHRFDNCGVYYFSDIVENECASYIGIIVVKPKPTNHDIYLHENKIDAEIKPIEAGDRVWWRWDSNLNLNVSVSFLEANLLYDKKIDSIDCQAYGAVCEEIDPNAFSKFGIFSTKISRAGVHYYKIKVEEHTLVSTIVASPPPKDHKIEISDSGFNPSIINVNPEDRIWFVWTDTKKSHNIRQVTHQDQFIKNGFLSGALMEPPGAYMHTFTEQGIFYYHSDGLKNCIGAVVVVPEPTIQVIRVNENGIEPDPLVASVYDTVLWVFPSIQKYDLVEIGNQNDLLTYPLKSPEIIPRKYISRSFKEANVYHFASPSLNIVLKKDEMDSKGYKNIVLSSVIVDKKFEYVLVTVDKDGFHPDYLNIEKNKSILFDWKDSDESHNIVHIKKPISEKLELIEGNKAFTSNELAFNDNFLYTFEQDGEYYIASEGARGHYCLVNVLENVLKTETPKLVNKELPIISKYHKIHLHCDTPKSTIYYTTNGMQPNKNSPALKLYDADKGIILSEVGFGFIRAVAISEGAIMSDIFTSPRFFVLDNFNNREELEIEEADIPLSNKHWYESIPTIEQTNLGNGCLEVSWKGPLESSLGLISHYQLFLNGVSYKKKIRSDATSVKIKGLCGGRSYSVVLMVIPKSQSYVAQQSNREYFNCPSITENKGPIISIKANPKENQVTLVWQSLEKSSVEYYQLIINDEKKQEIRVGNKYNKVIVDGFEPGLDYTIMIIAVLANSMIPLTSNEIHLKLPLDLSEISLPVPESRSDNKDLYDEYITVIETEPRRKIVPPTRKPEVPRIPKKNIDINVLLEHVPAPKVSASYLKPGSVLVEWILTKLPHPPIEIDHFEISLIGTEFANSLKSDASYDCFMEINGTKIPAVQHCWNVTNHYNSLPIDGILDTSIYQIFVTAIYSYDKLNISEFKKSSPIINYISLGPPHPPKFRVINVDIQSVTLEWITFDYPKPEYITGYRLILDSEYKEKFGSSQREFIFNELKPGKSYRLELVALTNSIIGQSEPSKPIIVTCPKRPKTPSIFQSSTLKINSVVISWKPTVPRSINKEDQILNYKVYLNNQFHGEIFSSNLSTYSYMIADLIPGIFYDVTVKALCGQHFQLPSEDDEIFTLIASDSSNVLSVTPTAPPLSPPLRLESIHPDGIDVTWITPQQYGEATISGYQMVINGIVDETILPAEATRTTVRNINLGDNVNLQIIALTNHPCGQFSMDQFHPNYNIEYALQNESIQNGRNEVNMVYKNNRYSACKPGPSLLLKFTNLVLCPLNVKIEKITGYSSIISWELYSNTMAHYTKPEYYSISYWNNSKKRDNSIKNCTTKNDYIQLNDLEPSSLYTIIVESRRESKRTVDLLTRDDLKEYTFLYYSKSSAFNFETASPPAAPSNLGLITSTCHGLRVCWDLPVDNGSELIATRVDCYALHSDNPKHFIKEFTPDLTECIIENLSEKTKYRVIITAITEEYLEQHKIKEIKHLHEKLEKIPWLPSSFIDVLTSGTEPASNLQIKITHEGKPNIVWKAATVYGTNILMSQILCYQDLKIKDGIANQIVLPAGETSCQVNNMRVGSKYKVWIEAVVSIKLTLDIENEKTESFVHYNELKNRRTTHINSDTIVVRVPAPCETPLIFMTGYSTTTVDLHWPKPSMYSEHVNIDDPNNNYIIYRHLLGYKIEVNGITQKELNNKENMCTLTNCKPSHAYNIVLIARTCLTDDLKHLAESDSVDIDESYSHPIQIKLSSEGDLKALKLIKAKFEEFRDDASIGRINMNWFVQDVETISQFNINWFIPEDAISHRKTLDGNSNSCQIPISKLKCIVEVNLEILYKNAKKFTSEKLSIEVPGAPNMPKLWVKEKTENNVIINWSEPRTFTHVPCTGYQLYVNDIKAGNKIDIEANQATVPLKPNRAYKIAIQALTSRLEYGDSKLSNILQINTYVVKGSEPGYLDIPKINAQNTFINDMRYLEYLDSTLIPIRDFYNQENLKEDEHESNLPLKITRIGEDFIDLDWSNVIVNDKFKIFKVQWHCWNTDKRDEETINLNITKFSIKRCNPGSIYSVRVIAAQQANVIANKSKYIIVQTNSPPDTPVLKLRACNFKYITIEWNRSRSYGDALIVGYKVYIDGKAIAVVSAEQTAFTLSNGISCHDYSFQIQALTERESYSSTISEPLVITWPGVKPQSLQLIEAKDRHVKIGWQEPKITGNAKVSFYRLTSYCEQTNRHMVYGPIEPSVLECSLPSMDLGRHKIQLEINVYGVVEPFLSTPLYLDLGSKPDVPILVAGLPALEERIKLDQIACNLINKRDRLLRIITNNGSAKQYRETTKHQIDKSMLTLSQLEEALDDCLNFINLLTGYFIVNLSWQCVQSSNHTKISGYRIYLNGKQYGTDLPESITNIRMKLSLDRVSHKISITSYCTKPFLESESSNTVEITTEKFLQFSFFCYDHTHIKSVVWPKYGCCSFQDALAYERLNLAKTRENVNIGAYSIPQPFPICNVFDLISGKAKSIIDTKTKNKIQIILFWTKWCLPSMRMLQYLVYYSRKNTSQYEFIACHHGNESVEELRDILKRTGFIDSHVHFYTDSAEILKVHDIKEVSVLETYDVKGIPTMLILNKNLLLSWKGRYCCYDYIKYENFMHHTLSEVMDLKCPIIHCDLCQQDTNIEPDLHELRLEQKNLMQYKDVIKRPLINKQKTMSASNSRQIKQMISIQERPYSGSRHLAERALKGTNFSRQMSDSSVDSSGFCYYERINNK